MDSIYYTKHFEIRSKKRGISKLVINTLLSYGTSIRTRDGAESIFFAKRDLHEIRKDLGELVFAECDRVRNVYIILSEANVAITIARSYRRRPH